MSHNNTVKGYAAYKVSNNVKHHYAVGLGVYDVFIYTNGASIFLDNAIEVPNADGVLIENACIVEIANGEGPNVGINNIINGTCPGITTGADSVTVSGKSGGYAVQRLLYYRNKTSVSLPDSYDYSKDGGNGMEKYPLDDNGLIIPNTEDNVKQPDMDTDGADKTIVKEPATKDTSSALGTDKTGDNYYEDKIKDCTDEWKKVEEANRYVTPGKSDKPKNDKSVADQVRTKYGVYVGKVFTAGNYIYQVTSVDTFKQGKAKLIGVVASKKNTLTTVAVPDKTSYKGYGLSVSEVGAKAFMSMKKLKKVSFAAGIKTIGASAFSKCTKLNKISFKNVTTIGGKAFAGCKGLKKVTIGSKVTKINSNTFSGCKKLSKVTIGKKVKSIGKNAFKKCSKLKTVVIGKAVKTISAKAFASDNKIKTITFKGKKLKKVKKNSFSKKVVKNIKSKKTKLKGNKKAVKAFKKKLKIK